MRAWSGAFGVAVVAVVVVVGFAIAARAGEPMFVRWLVADDPGDETIRDYWQRAESGQLEPPEMVDLGTMLFYRGFPKDAIRTYREALDADPDLFEAWFLIGLVEHSRGELQDARKAYRRCLKKRPGHGWCNFYYGLLEEQLGNGSKALYYYELAFKHAPELADPKVNPELLSSRLALGAQLREAKKGSFKSNLPMRYLQPNKVKQAGESRAEKPASATPEAASAPEAALESTPPPAETAVPMAAPQPTAPPAQPSALPEPPARRVPTRTPATPQPADGQDTGAPQTEAPYGAPAVPQTSDEALLVPRTDALYRLAEYFLSPPCTAKG
jgi:tetratricopeptide (TPR) repeat protein